MIDNDIILHNKILDNIYKFILKRGWKLKLAKKEPSEQSLFIHSLNELGAIQSYLQIGSYPFDNLEIKKLFIAAVVHDCEKEIEEWQEKLYNGEKPPHHTSPEHAKQFIEDLLDFLKENCNDLLLNESDINDIVSSQSLHMKASAKNPLNVFNEITKEHSSQRWSEIAHLIDLFDDIVSLESVESVSELLNRDEYRMLNEGLEFTYHKIGNIRGILTSLLHKSCEEVYKKNGFSPFLYFADGTIYLKLRKKENKSEITIDEVEKSLIYTIKQFIANLESDSKVIIENPQTKLFRGREFFDKNLIDKYFSLINRKYRAKIDSAAKKELKDLIEKKFGTLKSAKEKMNFQEIEDSKLIEVIIHNASTLTSQFKDFTNEFQEIIEICISKPQQYIFQLFKEIVYDDEILSRDNNFQEGIKNDYDSFFGNGAYEKLRSKSTSNPKKDFERYIKPYWDKVVEHKKIKQLSTKEQVELLSKTFANLLKNNIDNCSKLPKDDFIGNIASMLIDDLEYPSNKFVNIRNDAKKQLFAIETSKNNLFKDKTKEDRLCPVCYKLMSEANCVTAAFLSNEKGVAKVFNNQAVGGSTFGSSVNICKLCYAELLLRRVILGRTPTDLIILFPSLNFAKIQALKVKELSKDLQDKLGQFYSYHNHDLNYRVRLNDVRNIAQKVIDRSIEEVSAELSPDNFIESFKIGIGKLTKQSDLKKLENKIKDFWESVANFNKEFKTNYKDIKNIAEDIFANKCVHDSSCNFSNIPEIERNSLIEEAGVNPTRYSLVYETPNIIVISLPITFSFNKDEADVNILLKRLLFASYLYLLTDCTVMIIPGKEIIHVPQTRSIVYVQPNATLKQLIKDDWISLLDLKKWMLAVSASVKLAYEGGYSQRTGLFEVLMQPTVGHILSRITSQKTQSGLPKFVDKNLINIIENLKNTNLLKNEKEKNESIINSKV